MVTRESCLRLLNLIDKGLSSGLGRSTSSRMNIESCTQFAGLIYDKYVSKDVGIFTAELNDSENWHTNLNRVKGMRKLALAQLGSSKIDSSKFCENLALETIRKIVPIVLNDLEMYKEARKLSTVGDVDKGYTVLKNIIKNNGKIYVVNLALETLENGLFPESVAQIIDYAAQESNKIGVLKIGANIAVEALKETEGYNFLYLADEYKIK